MRSTIYKLYTTLFLLLCGWSSGFGQFHLTKDSLTLILSIDPTLHKKDNLSLVPENPFPQLQLTSTETLPAEEGVKSVIISPDSSKVYTLNLEGMSVFEYSRKDRKLLRKIYFEKTPAKGWDYDLNVPINSFEEKPVETCFSHNGRYMWISLHNGGGVLVWDLINDTTEEDFPYKKAEVIFPEDQSNGTPVSAEIKMKFIATGKTPKIISWSEKHNFIFVSNWHSKTISVIDVSGEKENWKVIKNISVESIPRGMTLTPDENFLYVAEMGGNIISKIDLQNFTVKEKIFVGRGPRHLVRNQKYLFVSLNSAAKVLKINMNNEEVENTASTLPTPRTIQLTPDGRILFIVSYRGNMLQAFYSKDLSAAGNWMSEESPVGLDIFQNNSLLEVWVCNYNSGDLKVFNFKAY